MTETLNPYLQLWQLTEPEHIAQTPTSNVYTAYQNAEKVVLKLLTPVGIEDESCGADALRHFDGRGAVRLLAHDNGAHLLEYVAGEELAEMVWRGGDLEAAEVIAEILNNLHHAQPGAPPPQMQTLRRRFRELFRKAAQDEAAGEESIYVRGARVAERLLANPQDECILHGDIHHHNIRHHPVRGWLAYDPKGLYGERTYDAANTLCNPEHASELVFSEARLLRVTQVLAEGMGVDVGRLRAFVFAYACLSATWSDMMDTPEIKQATLAVAHNAERHVDLAARR